MNNAQYTGTVLAATKYRATNFENYIKAFLRKELRGFSGTHDYSNENKPILVPLIDQKGKPISILYQFPAPFLRTPKAH